MDNEIDRINLDWKCYCPNCEAAWTAWLTARYGSVETLNERLRLDHWGLTLTRIADLPLPRVITEIGRHPGLASLEARFRRDRVSAFLREQARVLRAAGIRHPLTHNFFIEPDFTAEEPGQEPFLDFGSFDLYLDWQPVEDSTAQLRPVRLMEQQRGCYKGDFVLMETSMGTVGGAALVAPSATASTYRRRLLLALASGARGVLYWTGTVWRGGPWIFHGALHDHAGARIPEWDRIVEFGAFLEQLGPALLANPVRRDAAVIGSHAGNALASNFPAFPGSADLGLRFEDACRRRGLAVDILTPRQAASVKILAGYKVVALFGRSQGLVSPEMVAALVEFVRNGGQVIIGPLAGYVSEEGTIAAEGLAASLVPLTGSAIPVFRWFGDGVVSVLRRGGAVPTQHGFVESFHASAADHIEATFQSADPAWDGRPAIVRRSLGTGSVWKYLAVSESDDWPGLPGRHELLAENLPAGVLGVPRADGSLMLVNMTHEAVKVGLFAAVTDRFTGRTCGPECFLEAEAALWVEAKNSAV